MLLLDVSIYVTPTTCSCVPSGRFVSVECVSRSHPYLVSFPIPPSEKNRVMQREATARTDVDSALRGLASGV